jgi:hypothetical protein
LISKTLYRPSSNENRVFGITSGRHETGPKQVNFAHLPTKPAMENGTKSRSTHRFRILPGEASRRIPDEPPELAPTHVQKA